MANPDPRYSYDTDDIMVKGSSGGNDLGGFMGVLMLFVLCSFFGLILEIAKVFK